MISPIMYKESDLTRRIIGIAMRIHRDVGPGFPEKIYHQAMMIALDKEGFLVESEKEYDMF